MKNVKGLESAADLAQNKERNRAKMLGESRASLDLNRQRLKELEQYRDDYAKGFQSAGENGLSAVQFNDYQVFLSRLNLAIEQQQQQIVFSQQNCDQSQQEWLTARVKMKAIDKVVERHQSRAYQVQQRREQRETDDLPISKLNSRFLD